MSEILLASAITLIIVSGGFLTYQYYKQYKEQQYYAELKKQIIESILCLVALKGSSDLDMIKVACQSIPILKYNIPETLNQILETIKTHPQQQQQQQSIPFTCPVYMDTGEFSCPIKYNPKKTHKLPVVIEKANNSRMGSYEDYVKWRESLTNNQTKDPIDDIHITI